MEKIAVLIVSDPNSGVGSDIAAAVTRLSDVEVLFATDRTEVETQSSTNRFALVLIDTTPGGIDRAMVVELVSSFQRKAATPMLFITESQEEALDLCSLATSGPVDYVTLPFSLTFLQSKIEISIQLHTLQKRVKQLSTELDAKKLELEVVYQELAENNDKLESMSALDGLTGLFNRHYFDENLQKEWRQATRNKEQLSLLFIDVDYLREYNRSYGHAEGDNCLRELAGIIHLGLLRPIDIVARYGGDQFAVILPNTDSMGARLVAQRMLENVRDLHIEHNTSPAASHVTISVGGASLRPSAKEKSLNLIGEAERALVQAKTQGRNCIRHSTKEIS